MVAIDKKTGQKYQVVKYSLKVLEIGSDTEFGESKMSLYNPLRRCSFEVNPDNYYIVDNWDVNVISKKKDEGSTI